VLRLPPGLIGRDVDLGVKRISPDDIRHYADAVGDHELAAEPGSTVPLGFALALRGGPRPEIEYSPNTLSVHAGHVIFAQEPFTAPAVYRVRSRIADVFEKSGRSGALTVIAHRTEIIADGARSDAARCRVVIEEQEIVRWRHPRTTPASVSARLDEVPAASVGVAIVDRPEIGSLIGPEQRAAPVPAAVERYARGLGERVALFVDRDYAQAAGYADVIVPGPLQSALLEQMLHRHLPGWELRRLSVSFRVSVIAGEQIVLAAVITEHHLRADGEWLTCDLWVECGASDRATIGTAELRR
jgi:hydroxyacyl-ACP dehydratase HTD2-like protein with hotdog domain